MKSLRPNSLIVNSNSIFLNYPPEPKVEHHYPIIFTDNTCTMCGKQEVKLIDIYNHPVGKVEIHPYDHFECMSCHAKYMIFWDKDADGNMTPRMGEYDIVTVLNTMADRVKQT